VPEIGEALTGIDLQAIPEGLTANILPNPEIIFMQPGAKSNVWAALNNTEPLPSGTPIEVDFDESYERTDATWLAPEPMIQDFILYQGQTGFEAHFVASPSEIFDPVLLKEGVIKLEAHRPEGADGTGILGPAGGTITSPDGLSLTIPAGALASAIPVSLNSTDIADTSISGSALFDFLGSVELELGDATLSSSASLAITLQDPIAEDAQVLVVQTVEAEGVTKYELVAIASISGNTLTASAGALGLPLPGIREGGRYIFLQMTEPVGYVTGAVESGGQTVEKGLVTIDTLPFVSLTNDYEQNYALASRLGSCTVSGKSITDGSSASAATTLDTEGQIATINLTLAASRPTVVSVSPASGATGVQTAASVTVRFSEAMNPATALPSSLTLSAGLSYVNGTATLLSDQRTLVFRSTSPLIENTLYQLKVSPHIEDVFGQALYGNRPDDSYLSTFTTIDTTPPERPPAGNILATIPDNNGFSVVSGTQGTVALQDTVHVVNQTTGIIYSPQVESDGSFSVTIQTSITDKVVITLIDPSGNETTIPVGNFQDTEGRIAFGPDGGQLENVAGLILNVPAGAFPDGAVVQFKTLSESEIGVFTPPEFPFVAGFEIQATTKPQVYLKVSAPVPPDTNPDMTGIVAQVVEVAGQQALSVVDTAKIIDSQLTTASPPCPGVTSRLGRYAMYFDAASRANSMLAITTWSHKASAVYFEPLFSQGNFPFMAYSHIPDPLDVQELEYQRSPMCLPLPDNTQRVVIRDGSTGNFLGTMPVSLTPGSITSITYSNLDDDTPPVIVLRPCGTTEQGTRSLQSDHPHSFFRTDQYRRRFRHQTTKCAYD